MPESSSLLTRFDTDLISLRALVAIADSGSFSLAARQIGRTQSAVSLQIAKLEERLGVRLLERNSRSVRATSAGETMIAYARQLISLADEAMSAVSALASHKPLRMGVDDFHDRRSILKVLHQFNQCEPLTPLQLDFDHLHALQAAMQADELDLVVGHTLMGQSRTTSTLPFDRTVLAREPLVWAASSDMRSDEHPIPVVMPQARSALRQATIEALNASGITWRITTECNNAPALKSGVRAGLGVAALPLTALGDGILEAPLKLPALPASALFVDVPVSGRHPSAALIVEKLLSSCATSLHRSATSLGAHLEPFQTDSELKDASGKEGLQDAKGQEQRADAVEARHTADKGCLTTA